MLYGTKNADEDDVGGLGRNGGSADCVGGPIIEYLPGCGFILTMGEGGGAAEAAWVGEGGGSGRTGSGKDSVDGFFFAANLLEPSPDVPAGVCTHRLNKSSASGGIVGLFLANSSRNTCCGSL
jgi:hypothetical protein